jgi:hypothetical protein
MIVWGTSKGARTRVLPAAFGPRRACLPVDCGLQPIALQGDLRGRHRGTNVARTVPIPVPHPQPWPRKSYAVSSTLRCQQGLGSCCIAGGSVDPGCLSAAHPYENSYHFFGDGRRLRGTHAAARRSRKWLIGGAVDVASEAKCGWKHEEQLCRTECHQKVDPGRVYPC